MIKWPDTLVRDLALRKCVIVLGAGTSMNSQNAFGAKPKSWSAFLEAGVGQIDNRKERAAVKKLIKSNDYLTACELIKGSMGRQTFIDFITAEFQTPGFLPAEIHKHIFKLDSKIVITPNFDNIYDRYAQTESNGTVIVKRYTETDLAESVRTNKRLIIKMHGSIESANELIFTRSDYAAARSKYWSFYSIFDALAITNTFLFLGCGTNDPDIRLILEDYRYKFQYSREHYFVISKKSNPDSVNRIMEATMNLKMVRYDPRNDFEEFTQSIELLVTLVESKRAEIALNQSW